MTETHAHPHTDMPARTSRASRLAVFAYGAGVYVLFLGTFLYAMGFVADVGVPKGINDGVRAPLATALLINAALLSMFVVQHTIMARPAFKRRWTRIIPPAMERSTFVLATCIVLGLTFWQWRPLPGVVWDVGHPAGRALLWSLYAGGWMIVLYASFCIDHFDLFGLRQVVLHLRGKAYSHPGFAQPWIYKLVRNPLMLGFMIAFWSAPTMTTGRLLFALLTTGYIFMGIAFEERDLARSLGEDYRRYRATTPMLLPWPRRRRADNSATGAWIEPRVDDAARTSQA